MSVLGESLPAYRLMFVPQTLATEQHKQDNEDDGSDREQDSHSGKQTDIGPDRGRHVAVGSAVAGLTSGRQARLHAGEAIASQLYRWA